MRKLRTVLSMLLAVMMIASMLPTAVFAEEYGMIPVFEAAETETETGPIELVEIPEDEPEEPEFLPEIEDIVLPESGPEVAELEAEALTVKAPEWRMSADKKTVFIDQPVVTGGAGNYTYAYNLYNDQGVALNYFYSNDPAVAATFPGDCKAVMIIVVSDGVNQQIVYTDWFFITGFEGKYGAKVTYSDDAGICMTVRTPENMQYLGLYSNDTEADMFTASYHSKVTSGVRVWDIALPNQNYAELVVKAGRDLDDMTYLEKVDVNHVEHEEEGLTVQAPAWRMSADRKTVFIDQPVVTGGTGNYTYAYNLYNDQGEALNYFYSSDPTVAATFPGDCKAVMIIVVSDGVESKTVYTDWFWITGFSNKYYITAVYTSGAVRQQLTVSVMAPIETQLFKVIDGDFCTTWEASGNSTIMGDKRHWNVKLSFQTDGLHECIFKLGRDPDDLTYLGKVDFNISRTVSGTCGEQATWTLDDAGTLTISGYGRMQSSNYQSLFYNYINLIKKIVIEQGITSIGDYAFYRCSNVTGELIIPQSITHIGKMAFAECTGLTGELIIPDSVTSIYGGAFENCSGFNSTITLSKNISYMSDTVSYPHGTWSSILPFQGMNLTRINCWKDSYVAEWLYQNGSADILHYIHDYSEESQDVFVENGFVYKYSENNTIVIVGYEGNQKDLIIPERINGMIVSTIGEAAFSHANELTSVIIPDTVTQINDYAFSECTGLSGTLNLPENLVSIGAYAFLNCSNLTGSLIIPDSVTQIGKSAFKKCSGFNGNLILSNNIRNIGIQAFFGCSGFTGNLVLPNGLTEISSYAFKNCSGFTGKLVIPQGVSTINYEAFYGCSGLNGEITLPQSVTSIIMRYFINVSPIQQRRSNPFGEITVTSINCYRDSYADTWAKSNGYSDLIHYFN